MKRYEYKSVQFIGIEHEELVEEMNKAGADGWQVIDKEYFFGPHEGAWAYTNHWSLILMREIPDPNGDGGIVKMWLGPTLHGH
jgi:hypothetical protein